LQLLLHLFLLDVLDSLKLLDSLEVDSLAVLHALGRLHLQDQLVLFFFRVLLK
jgi:hypothetical protein